MLALAYVLIGLFVLLDLVVIVGALTR